MRIHWTARSAGVYISVITDAPPVMRGVRQPGPSGFMQPPNQFHQAGFFGFSPVSDLDLCAQIPNFTCSTCGQSRITSFHSYPHLDVFDVISKEERKRLGPVMRIRSTDVEIIQIVERMRQKWGVFVTAGTIIGPTRVKVTSKPKVDFHVLVNHAGLFCRRPAAEKLMGAGLEIGFVETPARGKYGAEAGYVEFVVPVRGHVQLPIEKSFCSTCFRYTPGGSFWTVLLHEGLPAAEPFFRTVETGTIIFSGEFVEVVKRLGITGFVDGETLYPVRVVEASAPRPTLAALEAEWRDYRDKVRELKRSGRIVSK